MYQVLDKDTIKMEILPHLSIAKRGYSTKSQLEEIVNAILYKLKTGVQWAYLPVKSLFSDVVLSYNLCSGISANGVKQEIGSKVGLIFFPVIRMPWTYPVGI